MQNRLVLPLVMFCAWAVSTEDAVKSTPDHNKVEIENEPVRVVRTTYPPGTSSPVTNISSESRPRRKTGSGSPSIQVSPR